MRSMRDSQRVMPVAGSMQVTRPMPGRAIEPDCVENATTASSDAATMRMDAMDRSVPPAGIDHTGRPLRRSNARMAMPSST